MDRIGALAIAALLVAACQPGGSAGPTVDGLGTPGGATVAPATAPGATGVAPASVAPASPGASAGGAIAVTTQTYEVTRGAHPHDVAVAADGRVWYTGQRNETMGLLDPATGEVTEVPLPNGAAPHGVITGPDGAAWITDQGLDAIIRVAVVGDAYDIEVFPAPSGTSPHTAVFDLDGILWFTGAAGWIGRLDPATGELDRYRAPRGGGPYGITVTPSNDIWFVSLQQSYLGKVDKATGEIEVIEPGTPGAGTRRVWSDSAGRLWVSYWNAGMLAVYDPATATWREWDLPGGGNQGYSMYVDETDAVWISDFGQNAVVRFDPATETFESFKADRPNAAVRQMLGRPGEAWGAESGLDRLIVFRYGPG